MMIPILSGLSLQEDSSAVVDTLSGAYSQKWDAAAEMEQSGAFIQFAASNDLISIVLGVSLIIWLVLLFFIIRVDRRVGELETTMEQQPETSRT